MINLSRVVTNPRFIQKVTRVVRKTTVDEKGRNVIVEYKSKVDAVVTSPKESELIRLAEASQYKKFKNFVSTTRFNPDSIPGSADIIIYKGNHYLVLSVDDLDEFGFTRAIGGLLETAVAKLYKE